MPLNLTLIPWKAKWKLNNVIEVKNPILFSE